MKTLNELRAFCEGFVRGLRSDRDFYGTDMSGLDDWVLWGGYYINLFGSHLSQNTKTDYDVWVDAYEEKDDLSTLGQPVHAWLIEGEQGESK